MSVDETETKVSLLFVVIMLFANTLFFFINLKRNLIISAGSFSKYFYSFINLIDT